MGVEKSEAEADAGVGVLFRKAHGAKDVGRFRTPAGAGRGLGAADALEVEAGDEGLAVQPVETEVGGVADAVAGVAVDGNVGNESADLLFEAVAEGGEGGLDRGEVGGAKLGGLAEAGNPGQVLGAGAEGGFLGSAEEHGGQAFGVAGVDGSDALGPVDFVGGDREEVGGELFGVDGEFAEGLGGVGVEGDLAAAAEVGDFEDGLHGAGFVVDPLDGNEVGGLGEGLFEGIEVEAAGGVDGDEDDFGPLLPEGVERFQNGGVLDGGGHDAAGAAAGGGGEEDEVVGFGAAAGENKLFGAATEQVGEVSAGLGEGAPRTVAGGVVAGGVAEGGAHGVGHCLADFGQGPGCRVVVEEDLWFHRWAPSPLQLSAVRGAAAKSAGLCSSVLCDSVLALMVPPCGACRNTPPPQRAMSRSRLPSLCCQTLGRLIPPASPYYESVRTAGKRIELRVGGLARLWDTFVHYTRQFQPVTQLQAKNSETS